MSDRYPGYDVLAKRDTPSWDAITRRVIAERLALPSEPRFLDPTEWATLHAISARILPQPDGREPVPIAALIDVKLFNDDRDGYRHAQLPPQRDAWRRGLAALEAESRVRHDAGFAALDGEHQDALLRDMQAGSLSNPAWGDMPPALFFAARLLADISRAYYAHPSAWSEIGFGGPASPRGYVRMGFDRRDPWEAIEARPGHEAQAFEDNRHAGHR